LNIWDKNSDFWGPKFVQFWGPRRFPESYEVHEEATSWEEKLFLSQHLSRFLCFSSLCKFFLFAKFKLIASQQSGRCSTCIAWLAWKTSHAHIECMRAPHLACSCQGT
jgi:hypothetical protein